MLNMKVGEGIVMRCGFLEWKGFVLGYSGFICIVFLIGRCLVFF